MPDLATLVREAAAAAGLDAVGITTAEPFGEARRVIEDRRARGLHGGMQFTYRNPERSTDPSRTLAAARSIVVAAKSYARREPPRPTPTSARVAAYAWRDHYRDLNAGLRAVADVLRAYGHEARVVADDNALVDRAAAVRAGIGWFGKNANVLVPGRGSMFVLGSVVTDADLAPSAPAAEGCGACTRCIPACPTGAITAPGEIDARRCLAWLVQSPGVFPREHRVALGDRLYGCDECQAACPANRLATRAAGADDDLVAWVDVVDLLADDDDTLMARHGRWYIPDRDPDALRRNALVILGNTGDGDDPRTIAALRAALAHDNAVVRAHAVWAAARVGRTDLLAAVRADSDDLVRAELADLPGPR